MRRIFADAAYYVGLLLKHDDLHDAAAAKGVELAANPCVTTDAVLVEVLAFTSNKGAALRAGAVELVDELVAATNVTIVHQSADLFFAGVDLYRRRLDKGYSLTDCMSMVVCHELGLDDVLTHDRHFEQEGFAILL
jgi:predicted nucleic acid-binding protein